MDGLTFISIFILCGTVCFVSVFLLAHLSDVSAQRHAYRMAKLERQTEEEQSDDERTAPEETPA